MSWRFRCQRCGAEEHGYPSEELVEKAIEDHMRNNCGPSQPDARLYVEYHEEEPDGKGGWQDCDDVADGIDADEESRMPAIRREEAATQAMVDRGGTHA